MCKMCLTLADALAPLDALAFWSAGTSLLELADPDVLWKGVEMEEER